MANLISSVDRLMDAFGKDFHPHQVVSFSFLPRETHVVVWTQEKRVIGPMFEPEITALVMYLLENSQGKIADACTVRSYKVVQGAYFRGKIQIELEEGQRLRNLINVSGHFFPTYLWHCLPQEGRSLFFMTNVPLKEKEFAAVMEDLLPELRNRFARFEELQTIVGQEISFPEEKESQEDPTQPLSIS